MGEGFPTERMFDPRNDPFKPFPIFLRLILAFPKRWREFLLYRRFVHHLCPPQEIRRQRFLAKRVNGKIGAGSRARLRYRTSQVY
jgi:hypothetical protein